MIQRVKADKKKITDMEIVNFILQIIMIIWFLTISYIDSKTQYIYDRDMIGLCITVMVFQAYNGNFSSAIIGGAAAAAIGFLIYWVAYRVYQEEAFGLGDVYLLGILGCYWSWPQILHFLCFAFLLGGIIAAIALMVTGNRNYRLALGPIFIFAIPLYYLCNKPTILMIFSKILQ